MNTGNMSNDEANAVCNFIEQLNILPMTYEVKEENGNYKVWDTKKSLWITKEIPSKQIADEICEDFNKMDNKDFSPIGMPDFSKLKKKL